MKYLLLSVMPFLFSPQADRCDRGGASPAACCVPCDPGCCPSCDCCPDCRDCCGK
jgi:hypothetical protein